MKKIIRFRPWLDKLEILILRYILFYLVAKAALGFAMILHPPAVVAWDFTTKYTDSVTSCSVYLLLAACIINTAIEVVHDCRAVKTNVEAQ